MDKNDTSDHESQVSIDTNEVKQNLDFTSEKETPTRQLSPIIESEKENEQRNEEEDSSNSPSEQEEPVEEEESDEHSDSTDMEPHYTRDSELEDGSDSSDHVHHEYDTDEFIEQSDSDSMCYESSFPVVVVNSDKHACNTSTHLIPNAKIPKKLRDETFDGLPPNIIEFRKLRNTKTNSNENTKSSLTSSKSKSCPNCGSSNPLHETSLCGKFSSITSSTDTDKPTKSLTTASCSVIEVVQPSKKPTNKPIEKSIQAKHTALDKENVCQDVSIVKQAPKNDKNSARVPLGNISTAINNNSNNLSNSKKEKTHINRTISKQNNKFCNKSSSKKADKSSTEKTPRTLMYWSKKRENKFYLHLDYKALNFMFHKQPKHNVTWQNTRNEIAIEFLCTAAKLRVPEDPVRADIINTILWKRQLRYLKLWQNIQNKRLPTKVLKIEKMKQILDIKPPASLRFIYEFGTFDTHLGSILRYCSLPLNIKNVDQALYSHIIQLINKEWKDENGSLKKEQQKLSQEHENLVQQNLALQEWSKQIMKNAQKQQEELAQTLQQCNDPINHDSDTASNPPLPAVPPLISNTPSPSPQEEEKAPEIEKISLTGSQKNDTTNRQTETTVPTVIPTVPTREPTTPPNRPAPPTKPPRRSIPTNQNRRASRVLRFAPAPLRILHPLAYNSDSSSDDSFATTEPTNRYRNSRRRQDSLEIESDEPEVPVNLDWHPQGPNMGNSQINFPNSHHLRDLRHHNSHNNFSVVINNSTHGHVAPPTPPQMLHALLRQFQPPQRPRQRNQRRREEYVFFRPTRQMFGRRQ